MTLRPYQLEACDAAWEHLHASFGSDDHGLVSMPTGSGKSHCIAELIRRSEGGRVLCVVPSKELVEQNVSKIEGDVAVYCAGLGRKEYGNVTVGTINSCYRANWPQVDLLIVDEAHLIQKGDVGMYRTLILRLQDLNDDLCIIGFTATPFRADGSGYLHLGEGALFKSIVYEIGVQRLVDEGWLCRLVTKRVTQSYDLTGVSMAGGDYSKGELERAIAEQGDVTRDAVTEALKRSEGYKCRLWFCVSVAQAEEVGRLIGAPVVTGMTPKVERARIVAELKAGTMSDAVNVGVFSVGFDVPHVDCLVILRPTQSAVLFFQILGRGMRTAPDKDHCLVLDHGDSALRLGTVCKPVVATTKGDGMAPYRVCPQCESILPAGMRRCPDCNFEFPAPETHISDRPSEAEVYIDSEPAQQSVSSVWYREHHKAGKPPSFCITYRIGDMISFSEWLCFEHGGFAAKKARKRWQERGGDMPAPVTTVEAMNRKGELKEPRFIWTKPDGKYTRITRYEEIDQSCEGAPF